MDEPIQMDIKVEEEHILCQYYQPNIKNSSNIQLEKSFEANKEPTKDGAKDFESISALSTNYCDTDNDDYDDNDGEEHECTLCARLFQSEKLFKAHIKEHAKLDGLLSDSGGEEEFQTINDSETKNADHQSIPSEKSAHVHTNDKESPHKCLPCPKNYLTKRQLQKHPNIHNGPPYKCGFCLKIYPFPSQLKEHMSTHSSERPYKCEICSKTFKCIRSITKHMRTHTDERPYECDICSKTFKLKRDLTRHKRIHREERPFTCETCSKSFHTCYDVKKHKRIHGAKRPYACETCSKSFHAPSDLRVHMRVHTGESPYKCEICSRTFKVLSNLNRHKGTHNGERPFTCETCSKTFPERSALKMHKWVHSGERSFTCETCSKSISRRSDLNEHMRVHSSLMGRSRRPITLSALNNETMTYFTSAFTNMEKRAKQSKPMTQLKNQAGNMKPSAIRKPSEVGQQLCSEMLE